MMIFLENTDRYILLPNIACCFAFLPSRTQCPRAWQGVLPNSISQLNWYFPELLEWNNTRRPFLTVFGPAR